MNRQARSEQETDYIEKLVNIARVAKVVKGGRRFAFSALVVVGDGKGRVGFATGKAREVPDAVKKATDRAKKRLVRIPLREGRTLHHDVKATSGAAKVYIRPAPTGTGIIAGGAMRAVFEALGMQDVVSKSLGTNNRNNLVRATMKALSDMQSPRQVATNRNKKVGEIVSRRESDVRGGDEEKGGSDD
jgi:small subunit ribosomal protein S5